MSWELSLVFKATVLLGVTLAAVGLSARARASRRHLILASAFAALVVLPVAAMFTPVVTVPLPIGAARSSPTDDAPSVTGIEWIPVSTRSSEAAQSIAPSSRPSLSTMLRGLWLLGAVTILAMLTGSLWRLFRLRRSGVPWIAGQTMAETMAKEAGVDRRVTVLLHERTAMPAAMGILRPTILLPPDAGHWTEPDLRRVLLHELEHVRRGDWWIQLSARAVCMLYWFHPLVWIALRQLRLEAERACDDAVVQGADRADYADQLVSLAERLSSPAPRLMLSMANRSDLSTRVIAILSPTQQRGRAGTVAAAIIIGFVAILMGTVASLQAVAERRIPASAPAESAPAPGTTDVAALPTKPQPTTTTTTTPRPLPERLNDVPWSPPESTTSLVQNVAPAQPPSRAEDAVPAPYVIGPDDVLLIMLWQLKEASGEVVVRPDGKISLPLVGDIPAAGLTPDRLRQRLIEAFSRLVQNPDVTVQVRQINSRKVFIVGEVVKPGAYQLSGSMTVLQLIATAGGLTNFAKRDAIVISRRVDGKNVNISFDYAAFVSGQQLEQNVLLVPGDTVVVR
jgi:polysaccharide export outer membrane protein